MKESKGPISNLWRKLRWRKASNEKIFGEIYEKRLWGNPESLSGGGSMLESSKMLRFYLPLILEQYEIKSIIDLACGDFNWMKEMDLNHVQYTGIDVVEDLIERNRKLYKSDKVRFKKLDVYQEPIESSDLFICRDLMVHQPHEENLKILEKLKKHPEAYLLATTFPFESENRNISTGSWRPVNLELAPYNLPTPLLLINELPFSKFTETPKKFIGLWRIARL